MSFEKRGVIEPGRTPPEDSLQKVGSVEDLSQHTTARAADAVKEAAAEAAGSE